MGLLGKIGNAAKKAVGGVGDVVKKVAPVASFIPGVGPLAAAALTVGGNLAGKLNDKGGIGGTKVFKDLVLPGVATYAGGKAVKAVGADGKIASIAKGLLGKLGDGKEGFGVGDVVSGGGKILGAAKSAVGGADGFDIKDILALASGGPGIYQGVKAAGQAGDDSKRARSLVEAAIARANSTAARGDAEYAANAPLRDAFRSRALSYGDSTNPFSRAAKKAVA